MILTCTFRNTFHLVISGSVLHIFSNLESLLFNSKSHFLGVFFFFFLFGQNSIVFPFLSLHSCRTKEACKNLCLAVTPHIVDNIQQIGKKVVSVLKNTLLDAFFFKKTSPLCKGSEFCKNHSFRSVRMIKNCIYIN